MIQLIIAARGGPAAKARLAGVLEPDERAGLTKAMLEDVLAAALRTPRVACTWVVSPTDELLDLAQEKGANPIRQADRGLNEGMALGLRQVRDAAPRDAAALLPADLPLLNPSDLGAALALADSNDLVLAPARRGGTGLVVIGAGASFRPAFGDDSFQRHRTLGLAAGLRLATFEAASVAADIDEPEDLVPLLSAGAGSATAAYLQGLFCEKAISDAAHR